MFEIIATPQFEKDINFYKRKRKYTKIDDDVNDILEELEKGNFLGDEITDLKLPDEESVFKVRAVNTSAKLGKSNGFRIIYYAIKNDNEIYLLTIYSKKDKEDISNEEIHRIIELYVKDLL